jgi:hypothetical protein
LLPDTREHAREQMRALEEKLRDPAYEVVKVAWNSIAFNIDNDGNITGVSDDSERTLSITVRRKVTPEA